MTLTLGRIPAAATASTTVRWPAIVVVSSADTPITSASCSRAASTNRSGATSTPRSWTSKPDVASIIPTRFLPISWMSPLTVPITTRPRTRRTVAWRCISGSSTATAFCIARAASIMSGRNSSPRPNCSPTCDNPGTNPSSIASRGGTPAASACSAVAAAAAASPSMMAWRIAANSSSDIGLSSWSGFRVVGRDGGWLGVRGWRAWWPRRARGSRRWPSRPRRGVAAACGPRAARPRARPRARPSCGRPSRARRSG